MTDSDLIRQLIAKVNRLEKRVALLDTLEAGSGVGGGAVDSVNSQTGDVVLDADDIDDSITSHKFVSEAIIDAVNSAVQPGDLAIYAKADGTSTLTGNWGFGTTSPVGKWHVRDGLQNTAFVKADAINTTPQVLIPNGAVDVAFVISVYGWVSDGGANHTDAAGTPIAVSGTRNVVCGSDTYQLRVNADGSFDIRRTAGSNDGYAALLLVWR